MYQIRWVTWSHLVAEESKWELVRRKGTVRPFWTSDGVMAMSPSFLYSCSLPATLKPNPSWDSFFLPEIHERNQVTLLRSSPTAMAPPSGSQPAHLQGNTAVASGIVARHTALQALFSCFHKLFEMYFFYIWNIKYRLITKLICKLRDEFIKTN